MRSRYSYGTGLPSWRKVSKLLGASHASHVACLPSHQHCLLLRCSHLFEVLFCISWQHRDDVELPRRLAEDSQRGVLLVVVYTGSTRKPVPTYFVHCSGGGMLSLYHDWSGMRSSLQNSKVAAWDTYRLFKFVVEKDSIFASHKYQRTFISKTTVIFALSS